MNGYNLTKDQLKRAWRIFSVCAVVGLVVALFSLHTLSKIEVGVDSVVWESVIAARLLLFRLAIAFPAAVGMVLLAVGLFRWIDCSALGRRLLHWNEVSDGDHVKAAKTLNSGLLLVALVLGLLLILAGTLR